MLFVPSHKGLSHHPGEYTAPGHCETGARVLAATLARLAGTDAHRGHTSSGL
jgi:acetylornithine deacetylase/succinyl-diaminopimelate desuccinylase-like protein